MSSFIGDDKEFDFDALHQAAKDITVDLNRLIDKLFSSNSLGFPVSNTLHRPIGVNTQGLVNTFMELGLPYESNEAKVLNTRIFETVYHGSLEASCELAKDQGGYMEWWRSPAAKGQLQFDLWDRAFVQPRRLKWEKLKTDITSYGLRNSLLLASSSRVGPAFMGYFTDAVEPYEQ